MLTNPLQRRFFKSNDLFELFTLGDVGPQQSTETGAIFAGTGSEIRLRKKKNPSSPTRDHNSSSHNQPVSKSSTSSTSQQFYRLGQKRKSVDDTTSTHFSDPPKVPRRSPKASSLLDDDVDDDISGKVKETNGNESLMILSETVQGRSSNACSSSSETIVRPKLPQALRDAWSIGKRDKLDSSSTHLKPEPSKITVSTSQHHCVKPEKSTSVKKKRKKKRSVEIDGTKVSHLDRLETKKGKDVNEKDESTPATNNEEDILFSLFKSAGVHSALKHDKIEQSGNPDYVLVEKEAERVAKEAADRIRQSRREIRASGLSVPTWTGSSGSAGIPGAKPRPRFGKKETSSVTKADSSNSSTNLPVDTKSLFGREEHQDKEETEESNAPDVSSSSLLARMKARNAYRLGASNEDLHPRQVELKESGNLDTFERTLLEDIREFMSSKKKGKRYATTSEILDAFRTRVKVHQNALFKELLKQVCNFERKRGEGTWKLKEEFL